MPPVLLACRACERMTLLLLRRMSPLVALFGHGATSELSPLSGVERKSDLGLSGQLLTDQPTVLSLW
jgi:hypothetical protein